MSGRRNLVSIQAASCDPKSCLSLRRPRLVFAGARGGRNQVAARYCTHARWRRARRRARPTPTCAASSRHGAGGGQGPPRFDRLAGRLRARDDRSRATLSTIRDAPRAARRRRMTTRTPSTARRRSPPTGGRKVRATTSGFDNFVVNSSRLQQSRLHTAFKPVVASPSSVKAAFSLGTVILFTSAVVHFGRGSRSQPPAPVPGRAEAEAAPAPGGGAARRCRAASGAAALPRRRRACASPVPAPPRRAVVGTHHIIIIVVVRVVVVVAGGRSGTVGRVATKNRDCAARPP